MDTLTGQELEVTPVQRRGADFAPITDSPLLAIAPRPTRVLTTSAPLMWQGILLEKHLSSPGERVAASINQTVISLNVGSPSRFEHRNGFGRFEACLSPPGSIMTTPPGPAPDLRLHTSSEFLHCALDDQLLSGVAEEYEGGKPPAFVFRPAVQDKPIRCLLGMMNDELETSGSIGRLYIDSLAQALAMRYLNLDCGAASRSERGISPLPSRILARVREKMEAQLDAAISLDSLAEESGYSKAHFLRMFRAATGVTPHQFVLDLRLKRAQASLRSRDTSIVDIALSCGFASQAHMTAVFRQRLEITPAEFRRNAYPRNADAGRALARTLEGDRQ